jgi:hypothetical protein
MFARLCTATGHIKERNAFLGFLPPIPNAWALNTGAGPGGECLTTTEPDNIHFDAEIVARFVKRADAQAFFLKLVTAQVFEAASDTQNVRLFRIRDAGLPEIVMEPIRLANQESKQWLYQLVVGMELVFDCEWTEVPDAN